MNRVRSVRSAKEHVAAWIASWIRDYGVGYSVGSVHVCDDDPKVVQVEVRVSHDECPSGEPILLEIRMSEVTG